MAHLSIICKTLLYQPDDVMFARLLRLISDSFNSSSVISAGRESTQTGEEMSTKSDKGVRRPDEGGITVVSLGKYP